MNKIEQKKLEKYYKKINSGLDCNCKDKKRFTKDLKSNISDYLLQNQNATFADVELEFGDADTIVDSLHNISDVKNVKKKNKLMRITLGVGVALAVVVICFLIYVLIEAINANNIVVT